MDQRFFMQNPMLHVPPENIEFEGEIIPCSDFRLGTSQPHRLSDQAFDTSQRLVSGLTDLRFQKLLGHAVCRPRFKILASFMMPIARMLARIYTILAPYGTRPRPIFETDMEAIFQEMKEKQEASDKAFEEVRLKSLESDIVDKKSLSLSGKRVVTGKPTKRSRKPSGPILGSTVQIVSRTFTDFTGTIKKPDKKKRSGMHSPYVTIGLTWNDNIADLILSDIVDEQK
ncbi:hypothetical protein Tco_0278254 [Tanacetum coccineum]